MKIIRKKYKNGFFEDLVEYYEEFHLNGWYENSEIETQDYMIDHAKENWRSIDCGSHIGVYSMLLSYLCPFGVVYAFDVCQRSIDMMYMNMAYNEAEHHRDFSNIFSIQVALGDRSGLFKETVWQTGVTAGNYGETNGDFAFDTLDNYANIVRMNQLNLIKIDVDGWELETLHGAEDTIRKFKPAIVFETSSLHFRNHTIKEVYDYLTYLGYMWKPADNINIICEPRK